VKKRVLIIVQEYPQISETYIKNEIDALWGDYDLQIMSLGAMNYPYRSSRPYIVMTEKNRPHVTSYLKNFAPDIIHGHYLHLMPLVAQMSRALGAPFTIRAHSFDILSAPAGALAGIAATANSNACLGILTFPFTRGALEQAGFNAEKIVDCMPVLDYQRFLDTSPNGDAIMNIGAALPKKNMDDYLRLSMLVPERKFNLYAMGYGVSELVEANKKMGARVHFIDPVEPEDMPAHYKRHAWLVYTASKLLRTVGWPIAIAEAQASGVGVCLQNVRPDLRDYMGDAGILFDTPEEAAEIIRQPVPQDMRERGFKHAKRCDIAQHLHLLTDLWK